MRTMRKTILALFAVLTLAFAGCFDTLEEITIAENGSGSYKTTVDMSGMFDMIEMMASMDTSAGEKQKIFGDKNFDSTINLNAYIDTATSLTAEQKRLMKNMVVRMVMSEADRKFVLGVNFPFANPDDLKKIMELNEGGKGLSLLGKGLSGGALHGDEEDKSGLSSMGNLFTWQFKNGMLERTLDEAKLAEIKNSNEVKSMGEAEDMLEKMTFKTIIRLPRPVTKMVGEGVTLSADKKTATLQYSLADIFAKPARLAYRIEY